MAPPPVPPPPPFSAPRGPAILVNLENQFFVGSYASLCVSAPVITVEKRKELLIAARFNVEISIVGYNGSQKDGHEKFLHDVCLKYQEVSPGEVLYTWPESDPAMAFSITKNTISELSSDAGLSGSETPSVNVSLGLTRSTELSVEYAVGSWTVSAHRIADGYQWYWAGTQGHTKLLTPDLTQTVSRHVVVKRKVALDIFPFKTAVENAALPIPSGPDSDRYLKLLREALVQQFSFRFSAQIRIKRRIGRMHRLLVASSNEVKGRFLKPHFDVSFCLRPSEEWIDDFMALGCRFDPITEAVDPSKTFAEMYRQRANPETDMPNTHDPVPEADELNDQDPTAEKLDANGHDRPKTAKYEKEKAPETDLGPPEETLEDKVARVCKTPETPERFRYPFGDTVDIDSILDEIKTKHKGDWGRLQGKSLTDLANEDILLSLRGIVSLGIRAGISSVARTVERARRRREMEMNMRSAEVDISGPGREEARQNYHVMQDFR